eukprot:scaffold628855_cov48-Prasinocladus_malaysianus.AAC.1
MLLNYEQKKEDRKASDDLAEWQVTSAAGACSASENFILAGTSEGELLVFGIDLGSGLAKYLLPFQTKQGPISAMGSSVDSSRGAEASGSLVHSPTSLSRARALHQQ